MKIAGALFALLASLAGTAVDAQGRSPATQPSSVGDIACPAMPVVSPGRMAMIVEPRPHVTVSPPASEADRAGFKHWSKIDPDGVCRYREENRSLPAPTDRRVIFLGDSITEAWKPSVPALFAGDTRDRGISGQTTTQMLVRFRADVIDLHPAVVHIMGGINGIACVVGTALSRSNIASMVELARAHDITVILGSVTPSSRFQGSPGIDPRANIERLNSWLRNYAVQNKIAYVDYHAALRDDRQGLRDGLSNDGVHPNRLGFEIMSPLATAAIARALDGRPRRAAR